MDEITADLLHAAQTTAVSAGQLLRDYWHKPRQITSKGFRDVVTDADFASQAQITQQLQARFPTHGFLVEEEDSHLPPTGDYVWIVDPVDGTSNYSRGMGNFCVSIGVAQPQDGQVLAGAIYDPLGDALYSGRVGHGAWVGTAAIPQQKRLAVTPTADLGEAIIALDWSHSPAERQTTLALLNALAPEVRTVRAIGSAALALAWVASGKLDMYFNLGLKPWDVAAGQLLVQEVGGQVSSWLGEAWSLKQSATIATNGLLHQTFTTLGHKLLGRH